jgi:hypothetical protein
MSNPNFVNDLVMMAKAFEELPKVQAELESAKHDINGYLATIQRLELRLIDRANEIDNLNAKVRTVEVERDHAETMFLETDGKLDAAKSVLSTLMGNAGAFLQAVEPPKPEPVVENKFSDEMREQAQDQTVKVGASEGERVVDPTLIDTTAPSGTSDMGNVSRAEEAPHFVDPTSAPSWAANTLPQESAPDVGGVSGESAASSTTGESAERPTASDGASTNTEGSEGNTSGVSVPSDPTQATESSSESGSSALASPPEPELRYSPEWYQWADAVGYWDRKEAAQ